MKTIIKRLLSFLLTLVMMCSLVTPAYASAATETADSNAEVEMKVGETATLKISGICPKTTWSSSDESVATVSDNGTVTGVAAGTATITAKSRQFFGLGKEKVSTFTVIVTEPETETENKLTVKVGETLQLDAESEGNKVTWTSSDKEIATVDKNGVVCGVSEGDVTITAKFSKKVSSGWFLGIGSKKVTVTRTFEITVLPEEEVIETYTVTFESNGGTEIASQDVRKGEKAVKPDDPARDDYTFTGWYVDEELTTAYDFEIPVTSDMTLYAGWEEVVVWTVTVNGKSVTLTTMPQVVDGEVFVPMIPVLTAMNFEVVWNESNDTLIAVRNGFVTRLVAGELSGLVNGEKTENLENTVAVMQRKPYGSAALLQEVFGAELTVDTESLTAEVTGSVPAYLNWFDANNFSELGTWGRTGSYLIQSV